MLLLWRNKYRFIAHLSPQSSYQYPLTFALKYLVHVKFRVTQQVSELGWVDFVFGYSTVCLILRGNQNWQSRCAIWVVQQSQSNPVLKPAVSPCTVFQFRIHCTAIDHGHFYLAYSFQVAFHWVRIQDRWGVDDLQRDQAASGQAALTQPLTPLFCPAMYVVYGPRNCTEGKEICRSRQMPWRGGGRTDRRRTHCQWSDYSENWLQHLAT